MEGTLQGSSAGVPYIGSKISLISNVDIRYEGVLHSINTMESTVALKGVRSFGTEGRRQPDIPPSSKTYEYIIFKGKDIKDLTVCEPAAAFMPDDPAVISVNVPPMYAGAAGMMGGHETAMGGMADSRAAMGAAAGFGRGSYYHMAATRGFSGMPRNRGGYNGMNMMSGMEGQQMQMGPMVYRGGRGGRGGMGGRGAMRGGPRRVVGELPAQPNQQMKKELATAFDFESSNAKFDKAEAKAESVKTENAENSQKTEAPSAVKKAGYDKANSFFDSISCETLDRAAGMEARLDRDKQRELDVQTFGVAASLSRSVGVRRGFGRGRGRGGYFGGRGTQRATNQVAF